MGKRTKLDRTIEKVGVLKNAIRDLFAECVHFGHSFDTYLIKLSERVYDTPNYKALPRWATSEIQGYCNGQYDAFEKHCLEGRWELDGIQYKKGEERDTVFKGQWKDVKYVGTYYIGTTNIFSRRLE